MPASCRILSFLCALATAIPSAADPLWVASLGNDGSIRPLARMDGRDWTKVWPEPFNAGQVALIAEDGHLRPWGNQSWVLQPWSLPAVGPHGVLAVLRRYGTLPDGGEFESLYLWLSIIKDGRGTRLELFEMDALDAALARFAELQPDPLRITPNEVARSYERLGRHGYDSDAFRALAADDFVFDDRKKHALVVGGIEEWIGSLDFLWNETHTRVDTRLIATAGDRLALQEVHWHESPGEAPFEIDGYRITEIDESGKIRAFVLFDLDDRAGADEELSERYYASGADGVPSWAADSDANARIPPSETVAVSAAPTSAFIGR